MRILFVNHTFPPESLAGSEVYVLNVAAELLRRGHEVAVFYRYSDPSDDEYTIKKDQYAGFPVFKINNTYRFANTFQSIYVNPVIAAKFSYLLHEFKPDLVHFNHTTNLSMSLVHEAKTYGCPVVYTLHDYWLLCQRGQLLRRDLSLCEGPGLSKCRDCLALQVLRGRKQRWVAKLLRIANRRKAKMQGIDLRELKWAEVKTPDKVFVRLQSFQMRDGIDETLQAHPPAEITYSVSLHSPSVLRTSIGMHPHTYNEQGGGVVFEILWNGENIFQRCLNPKKYPEHQGWHPVEIPLSPSSHKENQLVLRTSSEIEDNCFCTAGWRKPVIAFLSPVKTEISVSRFVSVKKYAGQILNSLAGWVAAFSPKARESVQHRHNWMHRVFDEVDLFIAPSRFLMERYIQHGLPKEKVIYSDYGFVFPSEQDKKPVQKPITFGYLGTWIPSKGVELALRAFQTVQPQDARLLVYGFFPGGYDGYDDYDSYLRSLAGPAVEFRGKYDPYQVYSILSEFDCLIMPSIWYENSPLTIHEAFLAKVPVISSGQGGMAELLSSGGGITFEPRNAESLRNSIQKIILEPEGISRLQASIPDVKSIVIHADELLDLYATSLNRDR